MWPGVFTTRGGHQRRPVSSSTCSAFWQYHLYRDLTACTYSCGSLWAVVSPMKWLNSGQRWCRCGGPVRGILSSDNETRPAHGKLRVRVSTAQTALGGQQVDRRTPLSAIQSNEEIPGTVNSGWPRSVSK